MKSAPHPRNIAPNPPGSPAPARKRFFRRGTVSALALAVVIAVGASCSEDPPADIPTTLAPITSTSTTRLATTTLPPPETALPETTTTSTTLVSLTEESMEYLEVLLAVEVNIGNLVAEVQALNDNWDNRSETGVSYGETDAAMEVAVQRAQELRDAFEGIQPTALSTVPLEHQTAAAAVVLMADTAAEMLDGLRSTDTGQARRSALVGFLTAFEIFEEAIDRLAEMIGDEATAALARNRTDNSVPTVGEDAAGTEPEPEPTTTTTTEPATEEELENPGNTVDCNDFATQAEAQEWFDTYFPLYGDVALIDTNNNGVACELLP